MNQLNQLLIKLKIEYHLKVSIFYMIKYSQYNHNKKKNKKLINQIQLIKKIIMISKGFQNWNQKIKKIKRKYNN